MDYEGNNYGGLFYSPDEHVITTITAGTSYSLVLSNRRLYKTVSGADRKESSVDLEDITGTRFLHHTPIFLLVIAGLLLLVGIVLLVLGTESIPIICFIVSIILFIAYLFNRRAVISFDYAGGGITYEVSGIKPGEIHSFLASVHLAKDACLGRQPGQRSGIIHSNGFSRFT